MNIRQVKATLMLFVMFFSWQTLSAQKTFKQQIYFNSSGAWDTQAKAIATDNSGNVYFLMGFYDNGSKSHLRKVSPDGSLLWEKTIGYSGSTYEAHGKDIVLDTNNNIYALINEYNDATGKYIATLWKYDDNGNLLFSKKYTAAPNYENYTQLKYFPSTGKLYMCGGDPTLTVEIHEIDKSNGAVIVGGGIGNFSLNLHFQDMVLGKGDTLLVLVSREDYSTFENAGFSLLKIKPINDDITIYSRVDFQFSTIGNSTIVRSADLSVAKNDAGKYRVFVTANEDSSALYYQSHLGVFDWNTLQATTPPVKFSGVNIETSVFGGGSEILTGFYHNSSTAKNIPIAIDINPTLNSINNYKLDTANYIISFPKRSIASNIKDGAEILFSMGSGTNTDTRWLHLNHNGEFGCDFDTITIQRDLQTYATGLSSVSYHTGPIGNNTSSAPPTISVLSGFMDSTLQSCDECFPPELAFDIEQLGGLQVKLNEQVHGL